MLHNTHALLCALAYQHKFPAFLTVAVQLCPHSVRRTSPHCHGVSANPGWRCTKFVGLLGAPQVSQLSLSQAWRHHRFKQVTIIQRRRPRRTTTATAIMRAAYSPTFHLAIYPSLTGGCRRCRGAHATRWAFRGSRCRRTSPLVARLLPLLPSELTELTSMAVVVEKQRGQKETGHGGARRAGCGRGCRCRC